MLKRNDLAKQFELIVQQEIQNHNDTILANNMAMQDIRNSIFAIEDKLNKAKIDISNKIDKFQNLKNELTKDYLEHKKDIARDIRSCQTYNKNLYDMWKENLRIKCLSFADKHDLDEFRKSWNLSFQEIAKDIDSFKAKIDNKLHDHERNISTKIEIQDKKIDDLSKKLSDFSENISSAIKTIKIDKDGLYREIEILKKILFIESKKIENIYMLIDRLKDKLPK